MNYLADLTVYRLIAIVCSLMNMCIRGLFYVYVCSVLGCGVCLPCDRFLGCITRLARPSVPVASPVRTGSYLKKSWEKQSLCVTVTGVPIFSSKCQGHIGVTDHVLGGYDAECKLCLTVARPSSLSTPRTVVADEVWDGRILCLHSPPADTFPRLLRFTGIV